MTTSDHRAPGRWERLRAGLVLIGFELRVGLRKGKQVNLRWIRTHLIEEYIRTVAMPNSACENRATYRCESQSCLKAWLRVSQPCGSQNQGTEIHAHRGESHLRRLPAHRVSIINSRRVLACGGLHRPGARIPTGMFRR